MSRLFDFFMPEKLEPPGEVARRRAEVLIRLAILLLRREQKLMARLLRRERPGLCCENSTMRCIACVSRLVQPALGFASITINYCSRRYNAPDMWRIAPIKNAGPEGPALR